MRKYAVGKAALALALVFGSVPAQAFADVEMNADAEALFSSEGASTAAEGTCGTGLTWSLNSNGLLEIKGTGDMGEFRTASSSPWYSQRAQVRAVSVADGVTSVANNAFAGFTSLTAVKIASSVTSIGESAFSGCSSLTAIELNEGLESLGSSAFSGCSSLSAVRIPTSLSSIGTLTFFGCTKLERFEAGTGHATIHTETGRELINADNELVAYANWSDYGYTVPTSVASIGEGAFSGCTQLVSVELSENTTTISNNAFVNCIALVSVKIPAATTIGSSAFSGCTALGSIELPTSVKKIGSFAFASSALSSITLPEGVEEVGDNAFYQCKALASAEIGKNVAAIGSSAFGGCESLKTFVVADGNKAYHTVNGRELVTSKNELVAYANASGENYAIPSSVTSIGNEAFSGCTSLNLVNIPESVGGIGAAAFYGCTSLTAVEVPSSVTSIGSAAFYGCTGLAIVKINDGVVSIGGDAFHGCRVLNSIEIPSSVGSIGSAAFSGCSGMTSAKLAEGVYFLGNDVFRDCSSLGTVEIPSTTNQIGTGAFYGCTGLSLFAVDSGNVTFRTETGRELISADNELIAYANASGAAYTVPSSVTAIANNAFYGCTSLGAIEVSGNVKSIGNNAFYGCSSLTNAKLDTGVEAVGNNAFRNCSSLVSVEVPSSVTSIGSAAFYGCSSLSRFTVSGGNSSYRTVTGRELISSRNELVAYANASGSSYTIPSQVTTLGNNAFSGCSALTYVGIPTSVTAIGSSAFWGCSGLTSIDIPSSCTTIGNSAFYGCTGLETLNLSKGVKTIGDNAFRNCTSLTSVEVPTSVTSLGAASFHGCTSLASMTFLGDRPTISDNAFAGDSLTGFYLFGRKGWDEQYLIGYGGDVSWYGYHEWSAWSTVSSESCTEDGVQERHCSVCDAVEDRYISATGHSLVWTSGYDATCDTPGLSDGATCSVCGSVVYAQESTPALGHDYIGTVTKLPTCSEEGVITYTCTRNAAHTYTEPIATIEHTWGEWVLVKEPTYTEEGIEERACTVCGATEQRFTPRDDTGAVLFVTRLYNEVFEREPDEVGLETHVASLMDYEPCCDLVVTFFTSPEFTDKGYDNYETVAIAYRAILDREGSDEEIQAWVDVMEAEGMSVEDLVLDMCWSDEFDALCASYGLNSGRY